MGNNFDKIHKTKSYKKKKEPPRFVHDPSENIFDYYDVKNNEVIGRGNFSSVLKGVYRDTKYPVAVKVIEKQGATRNRPEMLINEVKILKQLDHPNIIRLYDIFDTENILYLVMEHVTGGELFDRIVEREQYSEHNAKQVMMQLLYAIQYIHEKGIVHRDLKPENLLLENSTDDTNIKVTDFGLSKVYSEDMMKTACGTPGYVAPEVLKCQGYEKEVDMWSAGVILYILLSGYPPFYSENQPELFESIMQASYTFHSPYWDHISPEAKDLIQHLLVADPKERFTATEALQHTWFSIQSDSTPQKPFDSEMRENLRKHNSERKERSRAQIVVTRLAT